MEFNGSVIAKELKENLKGKCEEITLSIITNNFEGSISYLKSRTKLCGNLGINLEIYYQENLKNKDEFLALINKLNNDKIVTGIMIDRPLLPQFNEDEIFDHLDPKKDVDGCTTYNSGLLMKNKPCLTCLTPNAVMLLLEAYGYELKGKNAVVIGRSMNVGMPLAHLLINANATVTVCHSKTKDLRAVCKNADLIVAAIGRKEMIDETYVNEGTTIIDIGIHYNEDGTLTGDVKKSVYDKVLNYSPVPKGVGPLTSVSLINNLLKIKRGEL